MSVLPALLIVALIGCGSAQAQDEPAPAPVEGDATGPARLYPIVETIAPGSGHEDARALLEGVVERMGGAALDRIGTLTYVREAYHWRGDHLAFWEKYRTKARLEGTLVGRVEVPSDIHPDSGRSQDTTFIENGDDRFMMMNRVVFAQEKDERLASETVRGEVFYLLGPWLVLREGAELRYDGIATLETWRPGVAAAAADSADAPVATAAQDAGEEQDAEDARRAPTDYQQVSGRYHRITALNPPHYALAVGPTTEFWLDVDTGDLAYMRYQFRHKDGYYNTPMLIEIVESARFEFKIRSNAADEDEPEYEVMHIVLPSWTRTAAANDAWIREEILLLDFAIDTGLEEKELRRP